MDSMYAQLVEGTLNRITSHIFEAFSLNDPQQTETARLVLRDKIQPVLKQFVQQITYYENGQTGGDSNDVQNLRDRLRQSQEHSKIESKTLKTELNEKTAELTDFTKKYNRILDDQNKYLLDIQKLSKDVDNWKSTAQRSEQDKSDVLKQFNLYKSRSSAAGETSSEMASKSQAKLCDALRQRQDAELALIQIKREAEVRTLRRAMQDAKENISLVQAIMNRAIETKNSALIEEWVIYKGKWQAIYDNLSESIETIGSQFEIQLAQVRNGAALTNLDPVVVPKPPGAPPMPNASNLPSGLQHNRDLASYNSNIRAAAQQQGLTVSSASGLAAPQFSVMPNSSYRSNIPPPNSTARAPARNTETPPGGYSGLDYGSGGAGGGSGGQTNGFGFMPFGSSNVHPHGAIGQRAKAPTLAPQQQPKMQHVQNATVQAKFQSILNGVLALHPDQKRDYILNVLRYCKEQGLVSNKPLEEIIRIVADRIGSQIRATGPVLKTPARSGVTTTLASSMMAGYGPKSGRDSKTTARFAGSDPCPICICALNENVRECGAAIQSNCTCGVYYHSECLREWLKKNKICPTCREMCLMPDEYPSL